MSPPASNRRPRRRWRQARPGARSTLPATPRVATPETPPEVAESTPPLRPARQAASPNDVATADVALRPRRTQPQRPSAPRGERGRLYRLTHPRLIIEVVDELRKVVWPSRQETRSLTTVVVIVSVTIGAFLGAVDWGFSRLLERVLLP